MDSTYNTSRVKEILEEVRFNASQTANISFPTKEYVKAVFNVVRNKKITATSAGTGGQHTGGSAVATKLGTKQPETYATTSAVSEMLLFGDPKGFAKTNNIGNIGIDTILKFPNTHEYRRSENLRKKYILTNPTYSEVLNSDRFIAFVDAYAEDSMYLEEDPKENAKYYIQTNNVDGVLHGVFVKYISSGKGDESWTPLVSKEYLVGSERETIQEAIKYFIDNNTEYVNKIIKGDSMGDESMLDPLNTEDILTAAPKISLSLQSIKDHLPKTFTGNIANDIGHDYTVDLSKPKYGLLYLGNTTQDRVNDAKLANSGVNAYSKVYLFAMISPDENGEYTEFPGKMILMYSFAKANGEDAKLAELNPGYVYTVTMNRGDYPDYPIVHSQLIGKAGQMINAIPVNSDSIAKAIPTGIKPNFNQPDKADIVTPLANRKKEEAPKALSNAFESRFMWTSIAKDIVEGIK